MDFTVDKGVNLNTLQSGQQVEFEMAKTDSGQYAIIDLKVSDKRVVEQVWVQGDITMLMADFGMITLSHNAVAEWGWEAGEMNFTSQGNVDLTGFSEGETVRFLVTKQGSDYVLIDLQRGGGQHDWSIIRWSINNRFLVLVATCFLTLAGLYSVKNTPVDAIPDLSDVQVIIKTSYPGQAPQVVEDQVTYPLTTAMLAVPGAETVRGYSFFGDSYVYIIFNDDTDMYWARSRVLEYLSQVTPNLPAQAKPTLGPDATGVGWIYSYVLQDKTGQHDLAELRSIQDWFLKYELQTVAGVSEVATVGGMVKQYQVQIDPAKLRAYDLTLQQVNMAIKNGNQETGASVIEVGEAEHMVRTTGYLSSIEDIKALPLKVTSKGTPLLLGDIADINLGPQMRRGISEFNGEGEAVGGVIVMRFGENASQVIHDVKAKLEELQRGLPDGVEIVATYDRSTLIDAAVENLWKKLAEEFVVVAIVCALFLFHIRSSLVIAISLPIGILSAFIVMHWQGINANIMSLGGIAIAIGAMVDGAIVMIENVHKHIEKNAPHR